MIGTRILPILGFCLLGLGSCESSEGASSPQGVTFTSADTLRRMVVDDRGHVYIGAVNALYQLSPALEVLNYTITGPVQDNPHCAPPQLADYIGGLFCLIEGEYMKTTDNYNQLLLVDAQGGYLIACGSVYQGTCVARMLEDISFAVPESEAFFVDNYVVANDHRINSVGFIADVTPGSPSMFVGGFVSADDEFTSQEERKPAVVNRKLVEYRISNKSFSYYTDQEIHHGVFNQRSWHVKPLVDAVFVEAFNDDRFAYFFFHETPMGSVGVESRIARTCLSDEGNTNSPLIDSTYTSYIEIPISCSYEGLDYPTLSSIKMVINPGFFEDEEEDEKVLVGMFSRSSGRNSTKTAICIYSFNEIERRINEKVISCANGEGSKKIKSEKEVQPRCVNSHAKCRDVCTCNIEYDNYPLEVETVMTSHSSVVIAGSVHTLALNTVKGHVEMFLGVESNKLHTVQKFVAESPERIHEISDYNTGPSDKMILQIEVLKNTSEVLILTENSVYTRPISVCSSYVEATCSRCIAVPDPHCGWCEMAGKCTTASFCTSTVWRNTGQCTAITTLEPADSSMGSQRVGNVITVTTNNVYPLHTEVMCDFGVYGLKKGTVGESGQITCQIPYLNPPVERKHSIDFGLVSGDVILAGSENSFTFYNCTSYNTCTSCTNAGVGCGWCSYSNKCSEACDTVLRPDQCPILQYAKTYIPAGEPHKLEVHGRNFPKPFENTADNNYYCLLTLSETQTRLPAHFVNSSLLVCATNHTFTTDLGEGEVTVPVTVVYWNDMEMEVGEGGPPEVDVYRCGVLGGDCSSCRANSMLRQCGWCEDLSQCLLTTSSTGYTLCPAYSTVCRGIQVEEFQPKHGPVQGGTLVTIRGSNLGSRPSDITSILIAGLPCEVQSEGFQVSREVVCMTSPSGSPKHGLVEVTTSGDKYIYPESMYSYKNHEISAVTPSCGIEAGGTKITVTGEELNIGHVMSVIVAGTLCDVQGKPTQRRVQCKTRSGVVGQTKLQVSIDGGIAYSPDQFEVVPNPVPAMVSVNSSISSGGIPVKIRFSEASRLDCVQELMLIFQTVSRVNGEGRCSKTPGVPHSYLCYTPSLTAIEELSNLAVSYVTAHLQADNHVIALDPFVVHSDPVIDPINSTSTDGYIDWPMNGGRELVINGKNLDKVSGLIVTIGGLLVKTKVTDDHMVLMPPQYSELQEHRKRLGTRSRRDEDDVITDTPDKRSHKYSSEYTATVRVRLGNWEHVAGKLYYNKETVGGVPYVAIIIPIVGFIVLVVLLSYVGMKYHRSQRSHKRTLKTVKLNMEKLEMRVANECKDAFTALQTHLTDLQGDVAEIPFRPFSEFMSNVLFPGQEAETKDLLARLSSPSSKVIETPKVAQFRRLLKNRAFLQKFVEVVEADPHFDVANKCKMASLLVIVISNDMGYLTEVLFCLMEKLIDKFLAKKNHPQLLLRRTESVADKLLTHWLNYTCYNYLRQHAGSSIFTLFSAIKQQLDLGPQDEVTYEAKLSLNNEKMLRETIEFGVIQGTVRDLNKNEHAVTFLTCDSIRQTKRKVIESVHRNKPASQLPSIESFDLMYIRTGNTPIILRENQAPIVDGWKKLSILSDYKIDTTIPPVFVMIPISTDSEHSSLSPTTERRKTSFLTTKRYRSKGNLISSGMNTSESDKSEERHQVYHLVKHTNDISETDTLLSTKMMSEVFLTRLLSTKGTLQPYVDNLFSSVFMSREKVPPSIKYLFDFLERQAQRHNLLSNQAYIHTWKNNSLSLRFWMNVLKNPHFLLDITQTPTIDSSLNIVCGVFMDSCSTSDKGLTKDSPINKLLYAKDIPRYKKQVQSHYEQVSALPRPSLDFLTGLAPTGLNTTVAVSELLNIANKYHKQLQSSFGPDSPSLNLKFTSIIEASMLTAPNLV